MEVLQQLKRKSRQEIVSNWMLPTFTGQNFIQIFFLFSVLWCKMQSTRLKLPYVCIEFPFYCINSMENVVASAIQDLNSLCTVTFSPKFLIFYYFLLNI